MSATIARVRWVTFFVFHPKRLVALLGGIVTTAAYLWIAAVHAVPGVRRRKASARLAWQNRPGRSQTVA